MCCSVLQCIAVCCSVLQCVAVCYSVLQCVAVCYTLTLARTTNALAVGGRRGVQPSVKLAGERMRGGVEAVIEERQVCVSGNVCCSVLQCVVCYNAL